jgi:hypothetical protein
MDTMLIPISYIEEMYGSLFSRMTFWNQYHKLKDIFNNNIPMQISSHTREMNGRLFSLITLWYLFKTTKRCNVAHVHVKFIYLYYTMKMQRKDIKSLIFNATIWKCSNLWRIIKHKMSRKHSQIYPLIFVSYKNVMGWQLHRIASYWAGDTVMGLIYSSCTNSDIVSVAL